MYVRKNYNSKRHMQPMFTAGLFKIAKTWKQSRCPSTNKWIRRCDIYIYNGISHSHKKEWNNAICCNIYTPRDYHTKWSKSEREQILCKITYSTSKIWHKWTYLQNRNRQRPGLWLQSGWGVGEGWIGNLRLADANSSLKRINKVFLYSTGNYIQHPVINHNGKEYEKGYHICITPSICYIAEINTML